MTQSAFRLLLGAGNEAYLQTLHEVTESARRLMPVPVEVEAAGTLGALEARLAAWAPDALVVDWSLTADTLETVRRLAEANPGLRVLLLLPDARPEYRRAAWSAGACACVPRDRIEPEWLQAMLCVMTRARDREARIREGEAA